MLSVYRLHNIWQQCSETLIEPITKNAEEEREAYATNQLKSSMMMIMIHFIDPYGVGHTGEALHFSFNVSPPF